jgi:protein-S-isoprenylcysteine O-methyltransferase Ste14
VFDKKDLMDFLEKVPALRRPWIVLLTILYAFALSAVCVLFFFVVDRNGRFAPLISQSVMAVVAVVLEFAHIKSGQAYRVKFGSLAYQVHFYHLMLPILVAWYACCFHPLFIGGDSLLPTWLSIGLGILAFIPAPLASIHIEKSGFHTMTHGMDIYSIFPEETPVVHGAIYGFIRHPLYFTLVCMTFALGLFRNNLIALLAASLLLIPALLTGHLEDQELIGRYGQAHRDYIRKTSALFPFKHPWRFFRLLFFMDKQPPGKDSP